MGALRGRANASHWPKEFCFAKLPKRSGAERREGVLGAEPLGEGVA
jgi:hypothetical protein